MRTHWDSLWRSKRDSPKDKKKKFKIIIFFCRSPWELVEILIWEILKRSHEFSQRDLNEISRSILFGESPGDSPRRSLHGKLFLLDIESLESITEYTNRIVEKIDVPAALKTDCALTAV